MTKLIRTSLKYRLLSLIMCVAVAVSAMPAFTLEIQASAEENTSAETQAVDSPAAAAYTKKRDFKWISWENASTAASFRRRDKKGGTEDEVWKDV